MDAKRDFHHGAHRHNEVRHIQHRFAKGAGKIYHRNRMNRMKCCDTMIYDVRHKTQPSLLYCGGKQNNNQELKGRTQLSYATTTSQSTVSSRGAARTLPIQHDSRRLASKSRHATGPLARRKKARFFEGKMVLTVDLTPGRVLPVPAG